MDEGLKTLFALYKGTNWDEVNISEDEMAIAKEQGYLFDYPTYETHSNMLQRLRSILEQIDSKDIANAFLFSLSTRRLEYRSALGSYYYATAIPEHEFMRSHNEILAAASTHCYLCGWSNWPDAPKEFAEKWKGRGDEKQDTSNFWTELLEEVFGVEKVAKSNYLCFEKKVEHAHAKAAGHNEGLRHVEHLHNGGVQYTGFCSCGK